MESRRSPLCMRTKKIANKIRLRVTLGQGPSQKIYEIELKFESYWGTLA